ncbi:hypothetical protein WA026_020493 [Henosepilachna vigintioctopunctata]|uniref:CRAL-TRIO domain-containing protein n=1 Tax=Henosepilachna vigintioctopunctata TaxID=420089 RepID=A0AAW1VI07_9CUCU
MYKMVDANEEYAKDSKLKREDVENLRFWTEKQPHLPKITELQLILFLQSCYYSNERAKSAIENFFTVRTLFEDLFSNLNPQESSIQMSLDVGLSYVLPEVTPNGDKIVLLKLLDNNPNKYILQDQLKRFDMMLMLYMHLMGTNEGMQITFDFEGSTMSHLLKANPSLVKKYLFYLQEAVPIRLKHVHVINVPSWIDRFLALIKPFLKKELLDMIHIHTSMNTFYEYVPKKILPKEYGGSAESVDILKDLQNQRTNESKRVEKTNYDKIFGMEGTFKRLEID